MEESNGRRLALVTGCGLGSIGEGLAREFLSQGVSVVPTVLPGEGMEHLNLPNCHPYELDVTDEQSVAKLYDFVDRLNGGRLDILGNNAGVGYLYPAVDSDLDQTQKVFAVHVFGAMRMVKKFHVLLVRSKGVIFNTCSISAIFPTPWSASYGAAKAALYHYGEILRVELAPLGVRVVNVLAGEVKTNILKPWLNQSIPSSSVMAPLNKRFQESLPGTNPRMAPDKFAKGVVAHMLASNPGRDCWQGTWAPLIWFLRNYIPQSAVIDEATDASKDALASSSFHINELKSHKL